MKYPIFKVKFLQEKIVVEWREITDSIRLETLYIYNIYYYSIYSKQVKEGMVY